MEAGFWHQRWETNDIGFHQGEANTLLTAHFEKLQLSKGSRVFLPLCGKTRDIHWLLGNGYGVAGAELSELAIQQLFEDLGLKPAITGAGRLTRYAAENICIFVGDIFNLSAELLGPVDAVYDRAALVALPRALRDRYSAQLRDITRTAPQLLITLEYDQQLMDGPPFSINADEVKRQYASVYHLDLLETRDVPEKLKGMVWAQEAAWLLQKAELNNAGCDSGREKIE